MKYSFIPVIFILLLLNACNGKSNEDSVHQPAASADSVHVEKGYSDVNGLKKYYEIYGKGQTLVLVHGGGSTIQSCFGRIIPELAKHRRVVAMELQAHGRTSDRNAPESFEQDADDVATLLKNLKIEEADFLGFSNGGNTVMQVEMRHGIVRKMILASSFFKREGMYSYFWPSINNATLKDMPQQLKEAYKQVAADSNNLVHMFEKDRDRMINFKDWNAIDLQTRIHSPVFIVIGDEDVVMPEHAVEMYRLFHRFAGSQLAILPGGHGKYMGEITTMADNKNPTIIVPLIEEFLSKPVALRN